MKKNYRIFIFKSDGNFTAFDSYCSCYQADKAFYALCFMLNQKHYKSIRLSLVTPKGREKCLKMFLLPLTSLSDFRLQLLKDVKMSKDVFIALDQFKVLAARIKAKESYLSDSFEKLETCEVKNG